MKKLARKLSAMTLTALFASMQIASAAFDTGLNNAVIDSYKGGLVGVGVDAEKGSATLNFNNDAHVKWDTLNVGKKSLIVLKDDL